MVTQSGKAMYTWRCEAMKPWEQHHLCCARSGSRHCRITHHASPIARWVIMTMRGALTRSLPHASHTITDDVARSRPIVVHLQHTR